MTRRRIVIAEDESLARLDLSQMLENQGHEVVGQAADGRTAVELARDLHPDLVIMDIKMPTENPDDEIDGLEAASILAKEQVSPVLLMTAYSDPEFIDRLPAVMLNNLKLARRYVPRKVDVDLLYFHATKMTGDLDGILDLWTTASTVGCRHASG